MNALAVILCTAACGVCVCVCVNMYQLHVQTCTMHACASTVLKCATAHIQETYTYCVWFLGGGDGDGVVRPGGGHSVHR